MTIKRLLTALVLLPLVFFTISVGAPWHFALLVSFLACMGMVEFFTMALPPERHAEMFPFAFLGGMMIFAPLMPNLQLILVALGIAFLAAALHFLVRLKDIATVAHDLAMTITAFVYIPFTLAHLILLRQLPNGRSWLFLIMLIVMTNDTAAYYVGSAIGRRRLYPQVSPNKSIEGALGGLTASLLGALLAKFTFFSSLGYGDAVLAALLIGLAGQAGDLFESLLKRSFGVKDSGTVFPGHGGVLDRLDSIIFAAPVTYYVTLYLIGKIPL